MTVPENVTLRLDPETVARLRRTAAGLGVPLREIVTPALERELRRLERKNGGPYPHAEVRRGRPPAK